MDPQASRGPGCDREARAHREPRGRAAGIPRTARSELGEQVPPHTTDAVLSAYRDEGHRLAAAVRAAELVERALRGEPD
jgi:hypothetical protein